MKRTLAVVLIICSFGVPQVSAYNDVTTHPALTDLIVDYYNATHPGTEITAEEREWIVRGSTKEDEVPRWVNHFYDPVSGEGWTAENAGSLDPDTMMRLSKLASFNTPLPAKGWVRNEEAQKEYEWYGGNHTWQRAISSVVDGDAKAGYESLGYVLHILEDMAVPDHTRNDTHANTSVTEGDGSPYEDYAQRWTRETIKERRIVEFLLGEGAQAPAMRSIEDHIHDLATYSNTYFVSKDTIDNEKYKLPDINNIKCLQNTCFSNDEKGESFPLCHKIDVRMGRYGVSERYVLEDEEPYTPVFDAYFDRLARQAVLHGADVIRLFKEKVEEEKVNREYVIYEVSDFSWMRGQNISLYALVNSIGGAFSSGWDWTKASLSSFSDRVARAWGSMKSGIGSDDEVLRQVVDTRERANALNALESTFGSILGGSVHPSPTSPLVSVDVQGAAVEDPKEPAPNSIYTSTASTVAVEEIAQEEKTSQKQECPFEVQGKTFTWKVVINEVAWMGTQESASDEWIELANVSKEAVDISGWQLVDAKEQIRVIFKGGTVIPAGGFFLLERTDDATVPSVKADLIYKGTLSNSEEGLRLFDASCRMMDEALAAPDWLAGDAKTKRTMERGSRGLYGENPWHASTDPGGTPGRMNSGGVPSSTQNTAGSVMLTSSASTGSSGGVPRTGPLVDVTITEIMYDAVGPDEGYEWVEIRNEGAESFSLDVLSLAEGGVKHRISCPSPCMLALGAYGVIAADENMFRSGHPNFNAVIGKSSFSLHNTAETVSFFSGSSPRAEVPYEYTQGANGNGESLQFFGVDGWSAEPPTPGAANVRATEDTPTDEDPDAEVPEDEQEAAEIPLIRILISEVQIAGIAAHDEFLELYNPNDTAVSLSGWALRKRVPGGESATTLMSSQAFMDAAVSVPAHGYFLIAHADEYDLGVLPDMRFSSASYSLTAGNSIYIIDPYGRVVDTLGYGEGATEYETAPYPEDPMASTSIARRLAGGSPVDTDNNEEDFIALSCPTPTNASGGARAACDIEEEPEGPSGPAEDEGITEEDEEGDEEDASSPLPVETEEPRMPVISEVLFDAEGSDAGKEFIELYAPGASLDMTGWSLAYEKDGEAEVLVRLGASEGDGVHIAEHGYFLIGLNSYSEEHFDVQADAVRSATLPNSGPVTVKLFDDAGELVDEVIYPLADVLAGQSIERKAYKEGMCLSPLEGEGEFLGNGCDTGSADDLVVRGTPRPQSSANLSEPREKPDISEWSVSFDIGTVERIFSFPIITGATYTVLDEEGALVYEGTDIGPRTRIFEIGEERTFSAIATDRDGLSSDIVAKSIMTPSLFTDLSWSSMPEESRYEAPLALSFSFNEYPFVPRAGLSSLSSGDSALDHTAVVFYLNEDAPLREVLGDTPHTELGAGVLMPEYLWCYSFNENYSLVLPGEHAYARQLTGECGYNASMYMNPYYADGDMIFTLPAHAGTGETVFDADDHVTVAFYAMQQNKYHPEGPLFRLIAVDRTHYGFSTEPSFDAPSVPEISLSFAEDRSEVIVGASGSLDADTQDVHIEYIASTDNGVTWSDGFTGTYAFSASPGETYRVHVKACDDMGVCSGSAEEEITTPDTPAPFGITNVHWKNDGGTARLSFDHGTYPYGDGLIVFAAYINADAPESGSIYTLGDTGALTLVPPRQCYGDTARGHALFSSLTNETDVCSARWLANGVAEGMYLPVLAPGAGNISFTLPGDPATWTADDILTFGFYTMDLWGNLTLHARDTHRYHYEEQ